MSLDPYTQLINQLESWIHQEYDPQDQVVCAQLRPNKKEENQKSVLTKPNVKKEPSPPSIFSDEIECAEILLLTASQKEEENALLERMTAAVDKHISKAFFVKVPSKRTSSWFEELFKKSQKARWILISEMELYQLPDLMLSYQRQPKRALFGIPIFLLADLSAYLKNLELKKTLWNTLLSEL